MALVTLTDILFYIYIYIYRQGAKKAANLHIIRTVRTGKLWRRVESYHAYVSSSKSTLWNARGSLLVTDYNGRTI